MKFNKKKCKKCKWHGKLCSGGQGGGIFCNYGSLHKRSCLTRIGRDVVDIRGNDHDNCLMFEKGKSMRDLAQW